MYDAGDGESMESIARSLERTQLDIEAIIRRYGRKPKRKGGAR